MERKPERFYKTEEVECIVSDSEGNDKSIKIDDDDGGMSQTERHNDGSEDIQMTIKFDATKLISDLQMVKLGSDKIQLDAKAELSQLPKMRAAKS